MTPRISIVLLTVFIFGQLPVFAAGHERSDTYEIPTSVQPAGGGEEARSDNYLLNDTIGEPGAGFSRSENFDLSAGYRQTLEETLSIGCTPNTIALGTIVDFGQATGSGTCVITTDALAGYSLSWTAGVDSSSLEGWWKFDESTAGTFADSSGNANTGTGNGSSGGNDTPQPSTDVANTYTSVRSVDFDGTDDQVTIANESNFDFERSDAFSTCAWIHPDSFSSNGSTIISKLGATTTGWEFTVYEQGGNGDGLTFYLISSWSGNALQVKAENVLSTGVWQHVCATYDGSSDASGVHLYVNSMQQNIVIEKNTLSSTVLNNNSVEIGARNGGLRFTGKMDDVRVYSKELNNDEIRDLASKGPKGSMVQSGSQIHVIPGFQYPASGGLVGYWNMDESNASDDTLDWSGKGNDVTPTGASGSNNKPQPSTILPSLNKENSKSKHFDGTDDYLRAATFSAFPSSTMTACTWVKTSSSDQQYLFSIVRSSVLINKEGIWRITSGKLNFWDYDGGYGFALSNLSNTAINDGEWHHICFVKNGTSGSYYLDGEIDGTTTATKDVAYGSTDFVIGADYRDNQSYFEGYMDDFRIYNRVLSAEEIRILAVKPQSWSIPSNTAYWGARLSSESSDTDIDTWGTDGVSEKWLNIGDGSHTIVTRNTNTGPNGSSEIFDFRVEIGSSKIVPTGEYRANVVMTVSTL